MYENLSVPDERNPTSAYKLYMTKRPKETLVDGSPFYLTINNLHLAEKSWPYQVRNGSNPNLWEVRNLIP